MTTNEFRQNNHQIGAEARDEAEYISWWAVLAVMLAGVTAALALFMAFPTVP